MLCTEKPAAAAAAASKLFHVQERLYIALLLVVHEGFEPVNINLCAASEDAPSLSSAAYVLQFALRVSSVRAIASSAA
eukprot:15409-Heterococcus_DN1.PRE.2